LIKISDIITILVSIGLIIGGCLFYVLIYFIYEWIYENILKPAFRNKALRITLYSIASALCILLIIGVIYFTFALLDFIGRGAFIILIPIMIIIIVGIIIFWLKILFMLAGIFQEAIMDKEKKGKSQE